MHQRYELTRDASVSSADHGRKETFFELIRLSDWRFAAATDDRRNDAAPSSGSAPETSGFPGEVDPDGEEGEHRCASEAVESKSRGLVTAFRSLTPCAIGGEIPE